MAKLVWDKVGERLFEAGVKKGVLYLRENNTYPKGVAWNGLTSVSISPEGGDSNAQYADDIKYLNLRANEDVNGTIECFTYPDEFKPCNGEIEVAKGVTISQQTRKAFGFCYRTGLGNDEEGVDYGYKLHLIYGATIAPSEKSYETQSDSIDPITFSYDYETIPVEVDGYKPLAHIEINSTTADADKLASLEEILYGKDPTTDGGEDGVDARLPLPSEIFTLMGVGA